MPVVCAFCPLHFRKTYEACSTLHHTVLHLRMYGVVQLQTCRVCSCNRCPNMCFCLCLVLVRTGCRWSRMLHIVIVVYYKISAASASAHFYVKTAKKTFNRTYLQSITHIYPHKPFGFSPECKKHNGWREPKNLDHRYFEISNFLKQNLVSFKFSD